MKPLKQTCVKQLLIVTMLFLTTKASLSQPNILPASAQKETIVLTHATIHIGNGEVIDDGTIIFSGGKITAVGKSVDVSNAKTIDCTGKQVYPGLILSSSEIGLSEIGAIRSEQDTHELGELNPDVRS